ncbi:MAG TPA: histidine kinase [Vicinamibacteria bacterium]|nr:histidine kinase [Vicinamibacteria bacterium]
MTRRVPWLYVWAGLLLLVLYASAFVASGSGVALALRGATASVLPVFAFGIFVLHGAERLPLESRSRAGFALVQLGLLLLFALSTTAASLLLFSLDQWVTEGKLVWRIDIRTFWQTLMNGLLYASIAAAGYAREHARRSQAAAARAARAEALRAQAELALLRSQLNPHFVLNVLHTLLGLVRREPAVAEKALEGLGELLRYGLRMEREGVDRVALREEWAFVARYLELEGLRLDERLRLSAQASPEALDCELPPFALQPLVENAVNHAIAPRAGGGRVDIVASRQGDHLCLEVADDGPGASEAQLLGSPRLGLRLLRERLAMLYGEGAALRFEPAPGGGLVVRLELPVRAARGAAAA